MTQQINQSTPQAEFDALKEHDLYKSHLPPIEDPIHHDRTPACLL